MGIMHWNIPTGISPPFEKCYRALGEPCAINEYAPTTCCGCDLPEKLHFPLVVLELGRKYPFAKAIIKRLKISMYADILLLGVQVL
ncbi:MAG: hypothetical protein KIH06_01615 [Kiritimatiellae bacterium]|nr:hypothetical protein [Kiritimatiellia bacterium]